MTRTSLAGAGAAGLVLGLLLPAGNAGADPAEPSDFSTTVVGIEPDSPAISVGVIGGDSFIELTVERGTDADVLGYSGEEYLRFRSDGTVEENRATATYVQNQDRYGRTATAASTDSPEQWVVVSRDGRYAWHDHRAHWMSPQPPAGRQRGDRIQDGAIPLLVDGRPVTVNVAVYWESEPSPVPLVGGAVVGGFAVLIALSQRRRVAWVLAGAGAAAAAIGWWQLVSVPPEAAPSSLWWLLPAIAAASAVVAIPLGRTLVSHALVVLGGIELAVWVLLRRETLFRAILPTDAPFWLDRAVTSAAAVTAVAAFAAGALNLFRLPTGDAA